MSRRLVALLLVALVVPAVPGALGHGEVNDDEHRLAEIEQEVDAMPPGYTGPGREPYLSYFQGVWLYGQASATALRGQEPVDADMDGDWVVWEDAARSDIFLYSRSAGQGYYVTNDALYQHRPRVSDGVVVYEQRDARGTNIYAHIIETSETRKLSASRSNAHHPDIDGRYVAWVDDNVTNADIWAYDFVNRTAWNVHPGTDRDSDPRVLDERIYFRTYRFNLWDIVAHDPATGETYPVTSDGTMQSAPFSNGKDLLFFSRLTLGWTLQRYDVRNDTLVTTPARAHDTSRSAASGNHMVRLARDGSFAQLVVTNLTSGASTHVTASLIIVGYPLIDERTVITFIRTNEGASILELDVSPFAFAKRPALTITSPTANSPWIRPITMSGILTAGPEFTEPASFTYRVDDKPPMTIPAAERWRVTLDPAGLPPGVHDVVVRATFREGPPVVATTTLVIAAPGASVDLEKAGIAFHTARLTNELNQKILDNPAAWFLIPVVLVILGVLAFRLWLWLKPLKNRGTAEYVTPDDY